MTARNLAQALPGGRFGKKHKCDCGKAFYDLNRDPATCPGCGKVAKAPDLKHLLARHKGYQSRK